MPAHRKQVDQRTAYRKLAVFEYLRNAAVTGGNQLFLQAAKLQSLPLFEQQGPTAHPLGCRQALHQRGDGHDDHGSLQAWDSQKRREAFRNDVLVG
ncbi:hypothetical protein MnTg04_00264 [bacterium MnTg04]|nr:hypothetical protein MnTg04_00264 [bacterium MnTg04]